MKIYVAPFNTESGDRGVSGAWLKKPSAAKLKKHFAKEQPDDFEAGTLYWSVEELEVLE